VAQGIGGVGVRWEVVLYSSWMTETVPRKEENWRNIEKAILGIYKYY
jgi:hypothetical protein